MSGEAMELMKAGHKRVRENMEKYKECTPEGHNSLIDAAMQSQSDSEIIYHAVISMPEEVSELVISKLNGQAKKFQPNEKPPPSKTTKWSIGVKGITGENMKPSDVFKIGLAIVGCVIGCIILIKFFHLQGTITELRSAQGVTVVEKE